MASLLPFDPFRELDRIRREMDSFFDRSLVNLPEERIEISTPKVDVFKTDDKLLMYVETPGLHSDDVEVTTTEDTLTIKGDFKLPEVPDGSKVLMRERRYGNFSRTFKLPVSIKPEEVKASYKNGILEISIPLSEEHKTHNVEITVEDDDDKKELTDNKDKKN